MRVELLVVPDCPHEGVAAQRLRQALDAVGRAGTRVEVRRVSAETVAGTPEFAGSPTILVDGADPFAEQAAAAGALSCRMYRSEAGDLAGAPSVEQLRRVLRR
ncbi:thioredoxin family protein [Pseudonocardia sp. C8]|uniref:thioredoxin family protein n=1 Tax=Pseudonocardia sp. C8 TaxID=2762759 RepID=UPI001642D8C1|nr:thioredoxin family protein [Pseudonocardia sp. C8]MBC3189793.1 thioredoxin family protein [Pseudonocardia sp. C8]